VIMTDVNEEKRMDEEINKLKSLEPADKEEEPLRPSPTLANRPSSVASTHSNTSSCTPRTTTSRRGRTRSRSPPTMTSHSRATSNLADHPYHAENYERSGRSSPRSPRNLSSAAAAAAAAAKAISTGGRNTSPWAYENVAEGGQQHSEQRGDIRYHQGFDNMFGGSTSWPGEDQASRRNGHGREQMRERHGYSRHSQYPKQTQSASLAEPYSSRSAPHYDQYGAPYDPGYDDRYRESHDRGSYDQEHPRRIGRNSPQESPPVYPPGPYGDRHQRHGSGDPYYGGAGSMAPMERDITQREKVHGYSDSFSSKGISGHREAGSSTTVKRGGGTSRVIGTPTPIHVPRAADPPRKHSSRVHPAGTPSSVFRGRPDEGHGQRSSLVDSPQKILLSLRTPTTSYDERDAPMKQRSDVGNKGSRGATPLSPEEPPQIHHAHNQHQMDHNIFFERTSPGDHTRQPSGTLEMAPSFSLFNQSFDSLGDAAQYLTVGGPLDVAFHSNSFGAPLAGGSGDNTDNPHFLPNSLERGLSGIGLLGNPSGGNLTFGMSPVNSFGNGAPSSGGNMILGGPDAQVTSPTQMLSMYPSYSGGYSQSSGQQAPFRARGSGEQPARSMSSGSGGGIYARSFNEGSPHINYHGHTGRDAPFSQDDGPPSFYIFLAKNKSAFIKCSFLLPGLKAALLESPISDAKKSGDEGDRSKKTLSSRRSRFPDPSPQDTAIALRRVACAICAFGGSISGDRAIASSSDAKSNESGTQSIFRGKDGGTTPSLATTVTPSSSTGSPAGAGGQNREKLKYDEALPGRYYENENRLSWEFEESPPVGCFSEDEEDARNRSMKAEASGQIEIDDDDEDHDEEDDDDGMSSPHLLNNGSLSEHDKKNDDSPSASDQPKMRYRCKLCGQPKQNHTCPYQQSLQRSIGVMIYPAVNAFTSNEPGVLAPTLTDMNNFVSSGCDDMSSADSSPARPTPDRQGNAPKNSTPSGSSGPTNVTPETMRSPTGNSPGSSSLSTGSGTSPQRNPFRTPSSKRKSRNTASLSGGGAMSHREASPPRSGGRKRHLTQVTAGLDDNADMLFVEVMDLKPEQFRMITPSKKTSLPDAYTYPSLPLPYAQRKRLSDNLFSLSKEIPQLTDECAVVLRKARVKDMWDLAVAELMTQVVVVIHCTNGDCRFEGLRHYLLTLGIAC